MNLSSHLSPEGNKLLLVSCSNHTEEVTCALRPFFVLEFVRDMHELQPEACCFSPDGQCVVIVGGTKNDGFIMCLNREGILWKRSFHQVYNEIVNFVKFSADGKLFVVTTDENQCLFIKAEDGETAFTFLCRNEKNWSKNSVERVSFSRAGDRIALLTSIGKLIVLDSSRLTSLKKAGTTFYEGSHYTIGHQTLGRHCCLPNIHTLHFCGNDANLLMTHSEGTIDLRDSNDLSLIRTTKTAMTTRDNAVLHDLDYVGYDDETGVLLGHCFRNQQRVAFFADAQTGEFLGTAATYSYLCYFEQQCIAGNIFVSRRDGVVTVWDANSRKVLQKIEYNYPKRIVSTSICADGSRICIVTDHALFMLCQRPAGPCRTFLFQTKKDLVSTSLSLDGSSVLVADTSGSVCLFTTSGRRGRVLRRRKKRNCD